MGRINRGLSPSIQVLRPHHRSMARALVHGGLRPGDLAELYGMQPPQISVIMGSPCFLAEVNRLESGADEHAVSMREDIKQMSITALEKIDEDLSRPTGNDPKLINIRQKAAFGVLDMTEFGRKGDPSTTGGDSITVNQQINITDMKTEQLQDKVFDLLQGE